METSISTKDKKLKRTFRLNMLAGFIAACIAIYMIVTGSYDSIQAREATETTMGWLAAGSLLYLAAFWYMCLFRHQIFLKK